MSLSVNNSLKVTIHADHRNSICIECDTQMEVKDVDIGGKIRKRPICPECGGMKGHLIVSPTSIQSASPPQGASFKDLWKFVMDSLFISFLSSYHTRRVAYAEANRPEKRVILERYRTGEPAPTSLMGAIIANIKLLFRR